MRVLLAFAAVLPLWAQGSGSSAPAADPAPAPASPTTSAESWLSGYIELGYRGLTGVGGSEDTYRSVVNLGSGVKLTGTDITVLDPKKRLFERLRVRADGWGDDPYSSFHAFMEKRGIYKVLVDVRRMTYFNDLPSYADPGLSRGIALDEQAFDTRRHFGSYDLELFNGHLFSPYLMYDRDASTGHGVTVFQTNADEFAVPDGTRDSTDLYRAGTHVTGARYHLTLEAGGTAFKNDQNTFTSTTLAANPGNNLTPYMGQQLGLTSLLQDYGIRGNSVYTKAIFTASPFKWLDVYGHFMYTDPRNTVNYLQNDAGNFVLQSQILFYNSEQYLVAAMAKLPHTTGNAGVETRPARRIRILESWTTDRLHDAGSAAQNDKLVSVPATSTSIAAALVSSLASNYSQIDTTVIADVSKNVILRGGYRYVWGNASDVVLPQEGLLTVQAENLRRNVGLGAVTWRPGSRLSLTAELEEGQSTGAYFKTSLYNYTKARGLVRYQLMSTLRLSADYTVLSNRNPNAGSAYWFNSHQETLAVDWNPKGDRIVFDGSYSHCFYHSEIDYLVPQLLSPALSDYRENCHTISGYASTSFRGVAKGSVTRVTLGGSAVITSGSRPTTFYQPTAKIVVPLSPHFGVFWEWRYYGLGETFYAYESFRAHLITAGLRYSR